MEVEGRVVEGEDKLVVCFFLYDTHIAFASLKRFYLYRKRMCPSDIV